MLEEKLMSDYKDALKSKDSLKVSVLSFLRAELKNLAIAKKKDLLDDNDAVAVIRKQIKAHQDSIEQFTKGSRMDLAEKEMKELDILKEYLPPQLSEEEISKLIEEVISTSGALGIKDMGRVMKDLNEKISGKADGKLVSDLVKSRLSKPA